jgi:hypothetical protein
VGEKSNLQKHLERRPSEPVGRDYTRLEEIDRKLKGGVSFISVLEFNSLVSEVRSIRDKIKKYDNWRYELEVGVI